VPYEKPFCAPSGSLTEKAWLLVFGASRPRLAIVTCRLAGGMSQDHAGSWDVFSRQRPVLSEVEPMKREKVPVGREGRPVGREERGVASTVVVTVV
jgi:hypothetical protein